MQKERQKKILFLTILAVSLLSVPFFSHALEVNYPPIPTPAGTIDLDYIINNGGFTVAGLVLFIYGAAVWVGGILAFITLVYVGFVFIVSGAGVVGRGKAKRRLKEVLIGLTILLLVGIILNTINPDILSLEDPLVVFVAPGTDNFLGYSYKFNVTTGGGGGGTVDTGGDTGVPGLLSPGNIASACSDRSGLTCSGKQPLEAGCYYEMPDPLDANVYLKRSDRMQWGNLNLLQTIYTAAFNWHQTGGFTLNISDLNKDRDPCAHETHHNGTHGDIYHATATNLYQTSNNAGAKQNSINLVKALIDTGQLCGILFMNTEVLDAANQYFASKNFGYTPWQGTLARYVSGHDQHFHIKVKNPDGTCST